MKVIQDETIFAYTQFVSVLCYLLSVKLMPNIFLSDTTI